MEVIKLRQPRLDARNIALIGMAGVGKSTVARRISELARFHLIDTDLLIDYRGEGTLAFLKSERKAVLGLRDLDLARTVISTGGSVVYAKAVMDFLADISVIFFLDASVDMIRERLGHGGSRRIIGLEKGLEDLISSRRLLYQKYAHFSLFTDGRDPSQVAESVIRAFCAGGQIFKDSQ